MIFYSLEEALVFCDRFSPFTPPRNEQIVYPASLMSPWPWTFRGIIERTVQAIAWWNSDFRTYWMPFDFSYVLGTPYCVKCLNPYVDPVLKILFDIPLKELPLSIGEPEPFASFVEWRLRLGK